MGREQIQGVAMFRKASFGVTFKDGTINRPFREECNREGETEDPQGRVIRMTRATGADQ